MKKKTKWALRREKESFSVGRKVPSRLVLDIERTSLSDRKRCTNREPSTKADDLTRCQRADASLQRQMWSFLRSPQQHSELLVPSLVHLRWLEKKTSLFLRSGALVKKNWYPVRDELDPVNYRRNRTKMEQFTSVATPTSSLRWLYLTQIHFVSVQCCSVYKWFQNSWLSGWLCCKIRSWLSTAFFQLLSNQIRQPANRKNWRRFPVRHVTAFVVMLGA